MVLHGHPESRELLDLLLHIMATDYSSGYKQLPEYVSSYSDRIEYRV